MPGLNKFSRPILEKIILPKEKKIQHFYNGMFMTRRKLLGGNGGRYSRGPGNSEQKRQPRTLKNGRASKTQHKKLKTIFWPEPLVFKNHSVLLSVDYIIFLWFIRNAHTYIKKWILHATKTFSLKHLPPFTVLTWCQKWEKSKYINKKGQVPAKQYFYWCFFIYPLTIKFSSPKAFSSKTMINI